MLWYILQGAVFLAVFATILRAGLSEDHLAAALVAVLFAYLATELVYGLGRAGRFLRRFFHK